MSHIIRALTRDGGATISVIDSTDIVREMHRIHGTSATASAAFGRTLTAASLMGATLKNSGDSLTLRIMGDGPVGSIIAVSDYYGNVRGTCAVPTADLPTNEANGKLNVGALVGSGTLAVIKDLGLKEPYVGQVPLVSGEIAEDITSYYAVSEQIPTVCALGVLVDTDLSIKAAGGYLIQLLPGAVEQEIDILERNIAAIKPVTEMLSSGMSLNEMIDICLDGLCPEIIDEYDVGYRCKCSSERMFAALASLGKSDIEELVSDGKPIETVCDFCKNKYVFESNELKTLLSK